MLNLDLNTHHAKSAALMSVEQATQKLSSSETSQSFEDQKQSAQDVVAALSALLAEVQGQTANLQGARGQMNANLQQQMANFFQNSTDKLINEIQQAQAAQNNESVWDKFINGLLCVVGAVLTVCGFPEVGLPMLLMGVANLTGLTDKISGWIADIYEKMGASPEVANMLAQLTIFLATVAISAGSSIGTSTSWAAIAVKSIAAVGEGLMMAPKLFTDIAVVDLESNTSMSDADKKALEEKLAMIQAIVSALLMIVGGGLQLKSSLAEVGENGSLFSQAGRGLCNRFPSLGRLMDSVNSLAARGFENIFGKSYAEWVKGMQEAKVVQKAGQCFTSTAMGLSSGVHFEVSLFLAENSKKQAKHQAEILIAENEIKTMNNLTKSDMQAFSQRLQSQSKMMASIVGFIEVEGQSFVNAASNF